MSKKIQLIGLAVLTLAAFGCNSDSTQATPEAKKEFMGGPMPKGFMQQNASGMSRMGGAPGAGGAPAGAPAGK